VIVCHCRVVTDRQVGDAVRDGARSLSAVCRATGAGQDCGSCVFSLKRVVSEQDSVRSPLLAASLSPLAGVDVAAG